jgi:hypothetical protein
VVRQMRVAPDGNWTPDLLADDRALPGENGGYLTASSAGVAASEIYNAALDLQGHDGPLVDEHAETIPPGRWDSIQAFACWSPGGGIGRFH